MSPPGARPVQDIRLSPVDGGALLMRSYALRGRDGKRVCVVARDAAERGLSDGTLELWDGRHGVYLRAATLAYPTPRPTHVELDSRSMQHEQPPKGAIRQHVVDIGRRATGLVGGNGRRSTGRSFRRVRRLLGVLR